LPIAVVIHESEGNGNKGEDGTRANHSAYGDILLKYLFDCWGMSSTSASRN